MTFDQLAAGVEHDSFLFSALPLARNLGKIVNGSIFFQDLDDSWFSLSSAPHEHVAESSAVVGISTLG